MTYQQAKEETEKGNYSDEVLAALNAEYDRIAMAEKALDGPEYTGWTGANDDRILNS